MVRAIEGTTVTKDQVKDLECGVCGDKLNFDTEKLNEAIDHCGVRYGVSTAAITEPPLRVNAVKLPDELLPENQNKEASNVKKEKASVQTTQQQEKRSTQQQQTKSRKK